MAEWPGSFRSDLALSRGAGDGSSHERAGKLSLFVMAYENLLLEPGYAGLINIMDGWSFVPIQPHQHEELEFNLIRSGQGSYLVDDRRYALTPNTLIWLHRGQNHLLLETSPDFSMWIVVFTKALVNWTCQSEWSEPLTWDRPTGMFCKKLSRTGAESLDDRLTQIFALSANRDRFNAGLSDVLLAAWNEHEQALTLDESTDVHPAVERAVRHIQQEDDASLDDLADRVGVSPSHLSRLFKQHLGMSLATFRQRQRLERFFDLYGKGRRMNLTEAAFAAGFGSYPQFNRVFKDHVGKTPAEYRRELNR